MDSQPLLEGELVALRPLVAGDWDALYAIASNPQVWAMPPLHDRWREPVFRAFFADALAQRGALLVSERGSGRAIGSSRFQGYRPKSGGQVEIGWTFLDPSVWGSGCNTEMKRLMLDHAFRFVARVGFRVGEHNWRARRAGEKLGARLTDEVERTPGGDGAQIVHLVYEIGREDWDAAG